MKGSDLDLSKKVSFIFCLFALVAIIFPNIAHAAADDSGITQVLCNVVNQLQGGIGKAIATIAIIVLGVGLFMGKLSWPLAVATAIGIGMIFGAASIVDWVSSGTDNDPNAVSCS
ncbi:MAG: TrbC/VirB2 family protein [Alphaproteobacteria bacterium]|nr:TrbC/VirB2 family protein [Alphaproteobacteria bacterium]